MGLLYSRNPNPKGPCAQIVYTLALKYLYRDYIRGLEFWGLLGTGGASGLLPGSPETCRF